MPKIEAFEKYSDVYDKWFDSHLEIYESELAAIRQLMPSGKAESMEVGVGSGRFAVPLGIKVGVEPSEKMASKARLHGIDVYSGVAEELPFPDRRFDFVLMVTTLCFLDDVAQSLREAFRVLKRDGFIIVGFVDRESELGQQYSEKRDSSRFYKDATFFSTSEVFRALEDARFVIADVLQTLVPGELPKITMGGFGRGAFVVIKGMKKKGE